MLYSILEFSSISTESHSINMTLLQARCVFVTASALCVPGHHRLQLQSEEL